MKRSPLKRKSPMKRMSKKRRAENEIRVDVLLEILNERGNACEAKASDQCKQVATDGHELLTRARGGSIIDKENIILVCRRCHGWIHENPASATELGLLRSATAPE